MTTLDLEAFRAVLATGAVPVSADCDAPDAFHSEFDAGLWHDIGVIRVAATPHVVERDASLVERDTPRGCLIAMPLEGGVEVAQEYRRTGLVPGQMAIVDASRPFRLEFDASHRLVVVEFPRERLCLVERRMREVSAAPVAVSSGLGAVVGAYLASLGENSNLLSCPAGARLVLNALDLIGTLLEGDVDDATLVAEARRDWFERVRGEIDARLADPDLGPSELAAATHISLRQLYRLFSERGQRVATYIRTRRLERAYFDLLDPLAADQPISAVGAKWGFPSAAHFSRTFRDAYGVSPSDVRAAAERAERARPVP